MSKWTIAQAADLLMCGIEEGESFCLWGDPGIGKSAIVKQVAQNLSIGLKDVRLPLLDPVDLRGLPYVKDGVARWAVPEFLPQDGKGLMFWDEMNRAPMLTQNAALQIINDHALGEYIMPQGWVNIAACNFEGAGTGIQTMPPALANRFTHVEVRPDLRDWSLWAIDNNINPMVIAFLRFREQEYFCRPAEDKHQKAFPTPRTWEKVSKYLSKRRPKEVEQGLVEGAVGEAAAGEFSAFCTLYRNLPNIDAIILNPDTEPLPAPNAIDTLFAVTSALSNRATDQNFGNVLTYLERIATELRQPEYVVFAVKDATRRDESLHTTPEFRNWAIRNADLV